MKSLRRVLVLALVTSTGFAKAQLSLFTTYYGKIYPLTNGKQQCENEIPDLSEKFQSRGARVLSIGCPPSGPNHVQMIAEINPELPISFQKIQFGPNSAKPDFCETNGILIAEKLQLAGQTLLQSDCNKFNPQVPNLTLYLIPKGRTLFRTLEFFGEQDSLMECQMKNHWVRDFFLESKGHFIIQSLCKPIQYGSNQLLKYRSQIEMVSPSEELPTFFSGGVYRSWNVCDQQTSKLTKALADNGESVFFGICKKHDQGYESSLFYADFISPRVHSFSSKMLYSSLSQCETALEGARNNVGPRTRIIAGFCNEKGPQGYGFTFAYRNVFDPNK